MTATLTEKRGVSALVCAVCEQQVGAINVPALLEMLESERIYICTSCDTLSSECIEETLAAQPAGHYPRLVFQMFRETRITG